MKTEKLKIIPIIVPVLIIFVLAYITFISSNELSSGFWAFGTLMIFYPILFLLQGSACSLFRANIFLSLGISIAAYLVILLIWMNSSAIGYTFAYLLIGLIGFGVTQLIQRPRRTKTV